MKPWDDVKYQSIVNVRKDLDNNLWIDVEFANGDVAYVGLMKLSPDFEPWSYLAVDDPMRNYTLRMNRHEVKIEWNGGGKVIPWEVIRFHTDNQYARHVVHMQEEHLHKVGAIMQRFRGYREYSLGVLSERSGMSASNIQKIEQGDREINFSTMRRLLHAMGYTLRDMAAEYDLMRKETEMELLSCPGDTIKETIEAKGMSVKKLADEMHIDWIKVERLINGKAELTDIHAESLEKVLGIDAQFWLSREKIYREKLDKINNS